VDDVRRLEKSSMHALSHLAAGLRTLLAGCDAFVHSADFFATLSTCQTNLGAHAAHLRAKRRASKLKIGRRLANFRAADHQSVVVRLDVLATCFKAMVQSGLQADAMALHAGFEAGRLFLLECGRIFHGDSPKGC